MSVLSLGGTGSGAPADGRIGTSVGLQAKRHALEEELRKALDAYGVLLGCADQNGDAQEHHTMHSARPSESDGTVEDEVPRLTSVVHLTTVVSTDPEARSGMSYYMAPRPEARSAAAVNGRPASVLADAGVPDTEYSAPDLPAPLFARDKGRVSIAIHLEDGVAYVLMSAPKEQETMAREALKEQLQKRNVRVGRVRVNGSVVSGFEEPRITLKGDYY